MGGERGLRGRTLAAVALTLQEARAAALFVEFGQGTLPGLDGGTLKQKLDADYVTLAGYSDVPGVAVTGKLAFADGEGPALSAVTGTLRISGARAVHGTLTVLGSRLSGVLGGRRVSVKLRT